MKKKYRAWVVMGPAGAGKTTLGQRLSTYLGVPFVDADDHHSAEAKAKMAAGTPLNDADRAPWLARLRSLIEAHDTSQGGPPILACSALTRRYRQVLAGPEGSSEGDVRFIYLDVPRDELSLRLESRTEHFAGANLLDSQLATLERPTPEEALVLDGRLSVEDLCMAVIHALTMEADPSKMGDKFVP